MIHMKLYMEESQGLEGPEKISTRWPARCHVTRHVHVAELKETAQAPPLPTDTTASVLPSVGGNIQQAYRSREALPFQQDYAEGSFSVFRL